MNAPPPPGAIQFLYYALFAFAAGFSERFAHVILGSADLTVAKAATAPQTTVRAPPTPALPETAAGGNSLDERDKRGKPHSRSPLEKQPG